MKKLDDIPKKNVFKVPDGYFEELPTVIQSRMAKAPRRTFEAFGFTYKYALPVAVLVLAAILWFRPEPSIEAQLDRIDADQIAMYLDRTYPRDMDNEDDFGWTTDELDALEDEVYSSMEYSVDENTLDDIDL